MRGLPVESCGRDAERRQAIADRQHHTDLTVRGYWPSTYPGTCRSCGDYFPVGTLIQRTADGYRAECCA